MKNLISFILLFILAITANAANIGDDTVNIGKPGSTDTKALIFRDVNKSSLSVDHTTGDATYSGNKLSLGDGVDADKFFTFDIGLGANNPSFLWDTTKQKLRQSIGGVVKDIGSGSGSGGGENFNNGFTSEDNANAEDGTSGWTNSGGGAFAVTTTDPLEGDQSFTFTPSAQNDYVESSVLDFDKDIFKGRACEARITYVGGDENLSLKVLDANNDVLAEQVIPAHSITGQESIFFLCPTAAAILGDSNKGDLRLRVENTGASAAPLIKWDKSYNGTLRGLTETTLPDVFSAKVSGSSGNITEQSGGFTSCSSIGTAVYQCTFSQVFASEPSCVASPNRGNINRYADVITTTTTATIRTWNSTDVANIENFSIVCQKTGADAKQSVQVYKSIPKASEVENVFSGILDFSSNTFNRQNVTWVDSVTDNGTGDYTLNLNPSVNGIDLSCTCITLGGIRTSCQKETQTTTQLTFLSYTTDGNNTATDRDLNIICSRGEETRKTPTVQPIVVGQFRNSVLEGGTVNMRIETCQVVNSGTPSFPATNFCTSWIDSITDSGVGRVDLNLKPGVFDIKVNCNISTYGSSYNSEFTLSASTPSIIQTEIRNNSNTLTDRNFWVTCVGR